MFGIKKNLARWDRSIRSLIAVFMIGAALLYTDWIGDPFLIGLIIVFGILNLIASLFGWCPIYSLANISTFKKPNPSS